LTFYSIRARAEKERRRRLARRGPVLSNYAEFQEKYRAAPAQFVLDCFTWERGRYPADYQLATLEELYQHKRYALRGPHTLGKTALASWALHWFALTRDGEDWKIPTTASSWQQLTRFLWPEIHKWARLLKWDAIGRDPYNPNWELLTLNMRLKTGEAFAIASNQPELMEGAHADHLFYVYDEAKAIVEGTWDATEGAFAGAGEGLQEALALAISTPGEPAGRFYDIHSRKPGYEDWRVKHVKKEEAISGGRLSAVWVEQKARQWGEKSSIYLNRVEGEFAASDTDGVIPLAWVEAANDRWREWQGEGFPGVFVGVGVDVGGGGEGSDASVLALAFAGGRVKELRKYPRGDPNTATMELTGKVVGVLNGYRAGEAIVDVIGIGAGVVHRLAELRYAVRPFVASARTDYRDSSGEFGFYDWRSAGWWMLREMLEPGSELGICLPPEDELTGDLTAPHYKITSSGLIQVEDKPSIRRRIHRSTDCGDAVIHILTGPLLNDERQANRDGGQVVSFHQPIGDY
jgi:hypothetical protein